MKTLTKICACAALIGISCTYAGAAAEPAHVMWGCHAGYFFTPEKLYQASLDMLFAALEANPHFKAVLELEPYTIKRMKEGEKFAFEKFGRENQTLRDDERLEKLRWFMKRGQIEIVGGAYTQPIMHTIGEESVIRQFTYGIRAVEDALGTPVKIYGYQEDGSCSQIPQVLNAAGFEGVVAHTWFGRGFSPDKQRWENCWWVGSDGSKIHSVSTYCLQMPSNHTISQTLPNNNDLAQMAKAGFKRPLFGTFRDFFTGYAPVADLPLLKEELITYGDANELKARFVTLDEHFKAVGKPVGPELDFFEGRKPSFCWGVTAGERELADRESENLLLQTERLLAIQGVDAKGSLDNAWDALLCAQHHDARLYVAATRAFGIFKQRTYGQMVKEACDESKGICKGLLREAGCLLPDTEGKVLVSGTGFAIVNTSGFERKQVVCLNAALPKGAAKQPAIYRASPGRRSAVPSEVNVLSRHDDGSAKDVEAVLLAQVPGMGFERCEIVEGEKTSLPPVKVLRGESPQIDNGLVRVIAAKEGVQIVGQGQMPFPVFLTGNFPGKGELKTVIRATGMKNDGPSAVLYGEGEIGGARFKAAFKVEPESPMARLRLQFDFGEKTDIGTKAGGWAEKLRLVIPLPFASPKYFTHAAFEVRSVDVDGYPILRYAMAEGAGGGIAVFTDRSATGVFRKEPSALEIVLAYGGKSATPYSGGKELPFPLGGQHELEFGFYPYSSDWQEAGVPKWSEVFSQPLLLAGAGAGHEQSQSLVALQPEDAALITAVTRRGDHLLIRLWRPYEGEANFRVRVRGAATLERTDLLDRRPKPQADAIRMRQHQFVTLRAQVSEQ